MTKQHLRDAFPVFEDAVLGLEGQAMGVLHLLIEHCEDSAQPLAVIDDPNSCPNCGARAESLTGPYCSAKCRDQAAFVRQFRAAMDSGSILTPEKQLVFGERLWWLLGGGLPLRESRIPASAKRQVVRRSGGNCEICGATLTAVENFGSGCNRPSHLRVVCDQCSATRSFNDAEFSRRPDVVELLISFAGRVWAAKPTRACDNPHDWDWRAFMAERRKVRA